MYKVLKKIRWKYFAWSFFYNRKVRQMVNQLKKTQNTGKVNRRWLKKVNIKSFFKFIVIQVIILCKKFMHIKQ
ncbi:hypothetical protein CLOSTHATH_05938, partial [Hungatella hathewayi DSM 13479]